ncbi:MAG: hypothetical protein ACRDPK_12580 [Carbonactinosporaceae bacterium]
MMCRVMRCPACHGTGTTPAGHLTSHEHQGRWWVSNVCDRCGGEGRITT